VDKILGFFTQKILIALYVLSAIVAAAQKYSLGSLNNYIIFRNNYWHSTKLLNLYDAYPQEYFDYNFYGPLFTVIIAPFALMPDWLGCVLWNIFNVSILLFAIFNLPISKQKQQLIALLCLNEVITALLSFQFNVGIAGLLLLSFILLERQQIFLACISILTGFMTKLYGAIGFAFFFFIRKKIHFSVYFILCFFVLLFLPSVVSNPQFVLKSYHDWADAILFKADYNVTSSMADISFFGLIRCWFGVDINLLYGVAFGGLTLAAILLRTKQHDFIAYRLLILAYTLLCIVLFNTNVESPTFVIAFFGIAIWFVSVPKSNYTIFMLISALFLTSLSVTDLCPAFIREQFIRPYKLKVLPCIFIWADIAYRLLRHEFEDLVVR
jgi:Glycosyltransferase family 87